MLKNTLKRGVIGALIGMVAGVLIPCIINIAANDSGGILSKELVEICGSEAHAMLLTLFLTGIMGFVDCAGMTFYEMENWSLFRIMASHLAVIFAIFLPVAHILSWISSLTELLFICAFMIAGYFITWLIMCAIYRKQVKELNSIKEKNSKDDKDSAA